MISLHIALRMFFITLIRSGGRLQVNDTPSFSSFFSHSQLLEHRSAANTSPSGLLFSSAFWLSWMIK
jgi:hypothetical protein